MVKVWNYSIYRLGLVPGAWRPIGQEVVYMAPMKALVPWTRRRERAGDGTNEFGLGEEDHNRGRPIEMLVCFNVNDEFNYLK